MRTYLSQHFYFKSVWIVLAGSVILSGCAVVSLAATGVGAAASVTSSAIGIGTKVTGKVIGKTIDVLTPDSPASAPFTSE